MRRLASLVAACALVPGTAGAATRYVSPTGTGSGSCARSAPCSIAFAVNGEGSRAGDTVVLLRGTYSDQPITLTRALTVTGPETGGRPLLRTSQPGGAVLTVASGGAGSLVSHLALSATGGGTAGMDISGTVALDDLTVSTLGGPCLHSTAVGVRIDDSSFTTAAVGDGTCLETTGDDTEYDGITVTALNTATAGSMTGNGKVIDSTFTGQTTGLELAGKPDAHRVTAIGAQRGLVLSGATTITDSVAIARGGGTALFAGSGSHQLLNITAWGEGEGSIGVRAVNGAQLTVQNTIARAAAADIQADPATQTITTDCAAFTGCPAGQITVDHSNFVTAVGAASGGMNSHADPRFVDAAFENFHLRRGSPAIDAGGFEFNAGSADRDGRYRWLGKAPDMGAYEYPAPRPHRPKADRVAPRLANVVLAPTRFRVTRTGSAFAASRVPSGTTLSFHVDEDSDLVLTVAHRRRGAPVIGTIVRPFRRGPHRMTISGELNGGFLPPGRYVLTVIARDPAQHRSRARRLPVTVLS